MKTQRDGMMELVMSATEVIQLYDALPVEEQRIVADHILKGASAQVSGRKQQTDFEELVNRVFDKHSQLMERLEQGRTPVG